MSFFDGAKSITFAGKAVAILELAGKKIWESTKVPIAYQQVEYIQTDGNQYIDTGILASNYQDGLEYVFEGCATGKSSKTYDYLFGGLGSSKRSGNFVFIGSNIRVLIGGNGGEIFDTGGSAVSYNTNFILRGKGTSKDIGNFTASLNGTALNRTANAFAHSDMPSANIYLLAGNINGNYYSTTSSPFIGKLYNFEMFDMNGTALRHFVPCYRKADGVIGLYDTVCGTFYTNGGTGNFTMGAGNLVKYSTEADGKTTYNNGLGYKNGYRVRSGGEETASGYSTCTGFIPCKAGDVLRMYSPLASAWANQSSINVADSNRTNLGQLASNGRYGIFLSQTFEWKDNVIDVNGVRTITIPTTIDSASDIAFVRVTVGFANDGTRDGSSLIVTVNEEIPL